MRSLFKTLYHRIRQYRIDRRERRYVRNVMRKNGIPDRPAAQEQAWLRKWRPLHTGVSPRYLRCFSAYLSDNREQIVPGEISSNVVEPLLNPVRYRSFYEDKNVYGMLFDAQDLPVTYLRMMNGICYDAAYRPCTFPSSDDLRRLTEGADRVLVKPAVDSDSGRGIVLYRLDPETGLYLDAQGNALTAERFSGTGGGIASCRNTWCNTLLPHNSTPRRSIAFA